MKYLMILAAAFSISVAHAAGKEHTCTISPNPVPSLSQYTVTYTVPNSQQPNRVEPEVYVNSSYSGYNELPTTYVDGVVTAVGTAKYPVGLSVSITVYDEAGHFPKQALAECAFAPVAPW